MSQRVVGCIPAGRKRYMELLVPYLLKSKDTLNEVQLWANTLVADDLAYLNELAHSFPGFFRVIMPTEKPAGCATICQFWSAVADPETVYIRTDDDIVWIAPGAIRILVEFRLSHPDPFLVFGNIVNNGICSAIHQRQGCIPLSAGLATPSAVCSVGWKNPQFAEEAHKAFFEHLKEGRTADYLFGRWRLSEYERFSINTCCWFGKDFRLDDPQAMKGEEEYWVCCVRPRQLGRPNEICGQALFSHFAFFTQRGYLDTTTVLEQYRQIAADVL